MSKEQPWSPFYARDGTPMTIGQMLDQMLSEDPKGDSARVARDVIGRYLVSTSYLRSAHGFVDGKPLIYETMIFVDDADGPPPIPTRKYCTEEEALQGHVDIVAMLEARTK